MTNKTIEQKVNKALLTGAQLMQEHGLGSWRVRFNNKRTTLAETCHSKKTIAFSKHFVLMSDRDEFVGVTLHEITHALLGPNSGHGRDFVKLCKEISPNDNYAKRSVNVPIHRYIVTCPKCGVSGGVNRKRSGVCAKCLKIRNEHVDFETKENVLTVKLW